MVHIYSCVNSAQIVSKNRLRRFALNSWYFSLPDGSIRRSDGIYYMARRFRVQKEPRSPGGRRAFQHDLLTFGILQLSEKTLHLGILLRLEVNTIDNQCPGQL